VTVTENTDIVTLSEIITNSKHTALPQLPTLSWCPDFSQDCNMQWFLGIGVQWNAWVL